MGVNWNEGMMRWAPYIDANGRAIRKCGYAKDENYVRRAGVDHAID